MQDRLFENLTFPQPLPLNRFKRPLVLAPHPDDEVFGCGGVIALWAQQGVTAHVVVLTNGSAQDAGQERQSESLRATDLLGHSVAFWNYPDRDIRCTDAFVAQLTRLIDSADYDVVLCPALHEPHPDHQSTALSMLWCLEHLKRPVDLCFYESGSTLTHCTHIVDISSVVALKHDALKVFESQELTQPYSSRIMARDHFRAMTLGPKAVAAEGFQWLAFADRGWSALLPALDPLFLHARGQAVSPGDLPLISVLIRTVGDPLLEQAVACVCAQSYPRIELVVVAAHGQTTAPHFLLALGDRAVQWVCNGKKLNRPAAANAALDAARGQYCLFLDDDDLISPGHIAKLLNVLTSQAQVAASHTDVQVVNAEGVEVLRYDQPYSVLRLTCSNVFPIHSVLFSRDLVTQYGCRFDEAIPVLEDWDFWLQVSAHTNFVHVPGISAVYRYRDRSGLRGGEQDAHHHHQWRVHVSQKWLARWPTLRIIDAMAWHVERLDHSEQLQFHSEKTSTEKISELRLQLSSTEAALVYTQQQLLQCATERDTAQKTLAALLASRSWKLLKPLRWLGRLVRGMAS